jgi:hypothetical protein
MSSSTELLLGLYLNLGIFFAGAVVLAVRSRSRRNRPKSAQQRFEAITAAALAYSCYATSALLGGATVPEFFREHLYDGLAPAGLVGLLIRFFRTSAHEKRYRKFGGRWQSWPCSL